MKWLYLIILVLTLGLVLTGCIVNKSDDPGLKGTGEGFDNTNYDAPKIVVSKEITSFEYRFPTHQLNEWHGRDIPYTPCTFSLTREGEGARCTGSGGGYSGDFALSDFEFSAPLSALDDLQAIIDKHELAKVNGVDKYIQGIPENDATRLSVRYASGESIYAADNAGPILAPEASIDLYDFFLALAKEENGFLEQED